MARPDRARRPAVAAASIFAAAALGRYAVEGFSVAVLLGWLASIGTYSFAFARGSSLRLSISAADVYAAVMVLVIAAPLYLVALYDLPVQVNSDEVSIMTVIDSFEAGADDPLGLSWYLGHPALLFMFLSPVVGLFGGVDLVSARLVHALLGLVTIVGVYAFLRQLLDRPWSFVGAVVMAVSHSFLMISRMAMRENTAVLTEVWALVLLLRGLRDGRPLPAFAGGVIAGLGFYVYFPGRMTLFLWISFLVALLLFFRRDIPVRRVATIGAIGILGAVVVAGPVAIATTKASPDQTELHRSSLLIYPEAREKQREWIFARTRAEAYRQNVVDGLTTFNNNQSDRAYIYMNSDHGFVDPVSGVLVWVGVVTVGVSAFRRRREPWSLLPLVGFLALWLVFAFLINKAPNYTRLLITLPFVAFLVTEAIRLIANGAAAPFRKSLGRRTVWVTGAVAVVLTGAVAAANLAIAYDYISTGRRLGNDIGSTGRFVATHSNDPEHRFYISAGPYFPYYRDGFEHMWTDRLRVFAGDGRVHDEVIDPKAVGDLQGAAPFTIFMNHRLWLRERESLLARYPHASVQKMVTDGHLIAFTVPSV